MMVAVTIEVKRRLPFKNFNFLMFHNIRDILIKSWTQNSGGTTMERFSNKLKRLKAWVESPE